MFKIVVVPTGELTKEGKPKFKPAPTATDVKREISEQRVQTFGSGGRKISDTGRVEITVQGERKFVTPERALAISKDETKIAEAKRKITRRVELERTIRGRFKAEVEEAERKTAKKLRERKVETQREKVAKLILAEQRARGTKAEVIFRQRRIEEERKLGIREREKAVIVQFPTAAGRAMIQAQVFPKKFREDIRVIKPKEIEVKPLELELPIKPIVPELAERQAALPIQQTMVKKGEIDISRFLTKPPVSEVRAAPKPEGFLEKGFESVKRLRFETARERARGRITSDIIGSDIAAGVGFSLLLTAAGTKELVTRPVETVVAAGVGIKLIGSKIISGEGFPEIAQVIRQEPGFALGFVAGEIAQARVGGELIAATSTRGRRLLTRVTPGFKPVTTEALGVQKIKGVKIAGKKVDIGLIPKGKGLKLDVGDDLLRKVDIPLAKRPAIPRVSPEQRQILNIIREQKDIAGGSFAQRTLLQKKFTRPFADIDIAARKPGQTASLIKKQLSGKVKIKKLRITDSPVGDFDIFRVIEKKTGKVIADVDPLKFVEEGLATRFKTTKVAGIEFIDPQARLIAKARQLARGKTKGGKVAKDITALTGGKVRLDTPLTRGAFEFTPTEKSVLLGKRGPVTTSARDFFKILQGDEIIIGKEGLFATPFDPKTLEAQTRITRLGLEQRRASLIDILTGDFTFKRQKPQIIVFPEQKIGKGFKITPGKELQVLAAGGTIVRKQGKLGTTIVSKKVIPIFEADIGRASKGLERLTKQARTGKISTAGKRELKRLLVKETGFDVSRAVVTKPLVGITDILTDVFGGVTRAVRVTRKVSPTKRVSRLFRGPLSLRVSLPPSARVSFPPSRQPSLKLSFPPSVIPSFPPSARVSVPPFAQPSVPPSTLLSGIVSFPPSVPPSFPPSIPPIVPPITPPPSPPPTVILPPLRLEPEERRKGYNVFVKSKGKFKRVNKVPLTRCSALGRDAFLVDNRTAAQFKDRKSKSDRQPRTNANDGYFDLNRFKFRAFRTRLKRKKGIIGPLPQNQFIERRTNRIDTIGEIQGLSLAKLLARSRPPRLRLEI